MKRLGRIAAIVILIFLCITFIPLVGVGLECRPFASATPAQTTEAANSAAPAEMGQITASLSGYARPEDQTYLTLPEWYIVYSADEYAAFSANNPPSGFPYFQAIGQYWRSYYAVCAVTRDQYPFNSGYHLTLAVIGTSFTLENILKGIYENTLGRATEWLSSSALTEEDAYASQVAKEYGDFIHTIPWYEFPFDEKFKGLWRETNLWGPNAIRKWERKVALSLEYGGKAIYAWLIGQGTQAAYAPEDLEIQGWAEGVSAEVLQQEPQLRVVKTINDQAAIVALPRYEAFSQIAPRLARQGVRLIELAGNDEILITAIAPRDWVYDLPEGEFLFAMPILTQPTLQRVAVKAPVKSLHLILADLEDSGLKIEHVYDY
ncbi:MAG TPA: hypothetical protein VEC93_22030 [Anaerolineae bacterium]|nr:hypothetical protein [Anaerolineae bacterium]